MLLGPPGVGKTHLAIALAVLVARRYQKGQPLILTSNKAFGEWGSVVGDDPAMASAALDRLLHRSTILNIRGESHRLREKRQAGLADIGPKAGQIQTIAG